MADYQAALRAVTYQNTSQQPQRPDPDGEFHGQRRAAGQQHGDAEHHRDAGQNPPTLSGIETSALAYTESDRPRRSPRRWWPPTSTAPNLVGATVQITGNYQSGQDVLSFTNTATITGTWDATTGTLTLAGSDTVADYQAALRAVTYQDTSSTPSGLTRTVVFTVNDGLPTQHASRGTSP